MELASLFILHVISLFSTVNLYLLRFFVLVVSVINWYFSLRFPSFASKEGVCTVSFLFCVISVLMPLHTLQAPGFVWMHWWPHYSSYNMCVVIFTSRQCLPGLMVTWLHIFTFTCFGGKMIGSPTPPHSSINPQIGHFWWL